MKGENEVKYENVATVEKPPVYDHTKAIFVPEEKRTPAVPDLFEHLGMGNSKSPFEHELQQRIVVNVCLTVSSFFQIIVALLSILLGSNMVSLALVSSTVTLAGCIKLYVKEHISPKFFLVFYTGQCLLNTIAAGYGMLVIWSPSFCLELASKLSYQQCQNNLGFLQVMGSTVLIGHVVFQAPLLYISLKVYEHDEMIKNVKKQS